MNAFRRNTRTMVHCVVIVLLASCAVKTSSKVHSGDQCAFLPISRDSTDHLAILGLQDEDLVAMDRSTATPVTSLPAPCVLAGGVWFAKLSNLHAATAAFVSELLLSYANDADAQSAFADGIRSALSSDVRLTGGQVAIIDLPPIGDDSIGFSSVLGMSAKSPNEAVTRYRLFFRRGPVVANLVIGGFLGEPPSTDTLVALAQIIDGRIAMPLP